MSNLFRRKKQLIINNVVMPDLEIDFNIEFNKDDEQPVNDVSIINLTPETIRAISNNHQVILNAGYGDNMGNILAGKISDIETASGSVDRTLKLMVTPDISAILTAKVTKSYAPGTMASFIVKDLMNGVGLEVGTIKLTNDICYTDGKVFSGTVDAVLKEIVKTTNSFMFVRCNIIYIVDSIYEIDTGILLNKSTGLLGSPEIVDLNGAKGYKIRSLLNPMLTVGSVFRLESKYLSGLFRVENGTHSGNFETTVNCFPTDEVSRYVPPVKSSGSTSGENTPKGKIWTFLINKGFSKAATAGIMGNWEQESGYDPTADEGGEGGATGYGGYGIAQWTGGRRETLFAMASAKGIDVADLQFQLEHFYWEITEGDEANSFSIYGGLSGGLDEFKGFTDPIAACLTFEESYERAGIPVMGARYEYAQAVFEWDGGKAANGSDGSAATEHFGADAFKCACGCGLDCVPELKNKINQIVDNTGQEFVITSAARCENQNRIDNGVSNSEHLYGRACDGYIPGAGVDYLYNAAQNVGLGTIRYYSSGFVHCQTSSYDDVLD